MFWHYAENLYTTITEARDWVELSSEIIAPFELSKEHPSLFAMCISYVYRSLANNPDPMRAVLAMMINHARISKICENPEYQQQLFQAIDSQFEEMLSSHDANYLFTENCLTLFGAIQNNFDENKFLIISKVFRNNTFSTHLGKASFKDKNQILKALPKKLLLNSLEFDNPFLFEIISETKLFRKHLQDVDVSLLEIFKAGTLNQFEDFVNSNANYFEASNLSKIRTNLKILIFCSLADAEKEIPLDKINEAFQIHSKKELNQVIIQINSRNVGRVLIDGVRKVLIVQKCQPRVFSKEHWEAVLSQIQQLLNSFNSTS